MKEPVFRICEPHPNSHFEPYRLVELVGEDGDYLLVTEVDNREGRLNVERCPRAWFTHYDQTLIPGGLDTPVQRAHFELSRASGQCVVRYAERTYGKDTREQRAYLTRILKDRDVDASTFTADNWNNLLAGLRYNWRD